MVRAGKRKLTCSGSGAGSVHRTMEACGCGVRRGVFAEGRQAQH